MVSEKRAMRNSDGTVREFRVTPDSWRPVRYLKYYLMFFILPAAGFLAWLAVRRDLGIPLEAIWVFCGFLALIFVFILCTMHLPANYVQANQHGLWLHDAKSTSKQVLWKDLSQLRWSQARCCLVLETAQGETLRVGSQRHEGMEDLAWLLATNANSVRPRFSQPEISWRWSPANVHILFGSAMILIAGVFCLILGGIRQELALLLFALCAFAVFLWDLAQCRRWVKLVRVEGADLLIKSVWKERRIPLAEVESAGFLWKRQYGYQLPIMVLNVRLKSGALIDVNPSGADPFSVYSMLREAGGF